MAPGASVRASFLPAFLSIVALSSPFSFMLIVSKIARRRGVDRDPLAGCAILSWSLPPEGSLGAHHRQEQ